MKGTKKLFCLLMMLAMFALVGCGGGGGNKSGNAPAPKPAEPKIEKVLIADCVKVALPEGFKPDENDRNFVNCVFTRKIDDKNREMIEFFPGTNKIDVEAKSAAKRGGYKQLDDKIIKGRKWHVYEFKMGKTPSALYITETPDKKNLSITTRYIAPNDRVVVRMLENLEFDGKDTLTQYFRWQKKMRAEKAEKAKQAK